MYGCSKCTGMFAWLLLIFGVIFLLVDVRVWDFWNIQWWTVLFLLFGMAKLGMGSCKDCKAMHKK